MSWPEQPEAIVQFAGDVCTVGTPLVVRVVANVVVEVVEILSVAETTIAAEVVITAVPSEVVVKVEPSAVTVTLNLVSDVRVNVLCTGTLLVVATIIVVLDVAVGTVSVSVVVAVVQFSLRKGAVVHNGCKVEALTLGILVIKGCTGGLPAVSSRV